MRKALPKELVRRSNLTLPGREAASLDFLRVETEASSDSEVTRQALRYLEQLVDDEKHGVTLKVVTRAGEQILSSDRFRDRPEATKDNLIRRSLILHEQSERRLQKLQAAIGANDASEVVRCALRFYEAIVRAAVDGAQFFAQLPSGEQFRVRFGSFAPAEPASVSTEARPRKSSHQPTPPGQNRPGGSSSEPESVRALVSARNR